MTKRSWTATTTTRRWLLPSFVCAVVLTVVHHHHPVAALSSSSTSTTGTKQTLGLLTFDLDDTLFPTSAVVQAANAVMMARMQMATGCSSTALTLDDFLATTRHIRQELQGTTPLTYSDLRRRAIAATLQRVVGVENDSVLVEECFDAWLQERHAAAERYVFDDAIAMLQAIRLQHPNCCIAAITNGRGNPLHMPNTLQPYFDFCVSGEDANVFPHAKPHAGIYQTALQRYREQQQHYGPEEGVWCHVGDCLANDVGASAANGALAIWYAPRDDDDDDDDETASSRLLRGSTSMPSWSTATAQDLHRRAARAQEGRRHVAAQISRLSQLPHALQGLLTTTESLSSSSSLPAATRGTNPNAA